MRILIIEDDKTLNDQLCGLLAGKKFRPIAAMNEKEAEDALSEHGASIAVALVDMFLPSKDSRANDKESGLRLIELMSSQYPWVVKIVFTGNADLTNAAQCMEAGAFSYCEKGEDLEILLHKVRKAEAKYLKDQIVGNGIRNLRIEAEKVRSGLTNLISNIDRLSDEFSAESCQRNPHASESGRNNHGAK